MSASRADSLARASAGAKVDDEPATAEQQLGGSLEAEAPLDAVDNVQIVYEQDGGGTGTHVVYVSFDRGGSPGLLELNATGDALRGSWFASTDPTIIYDIEGPRADP